MCEPTAVREKVCPACQQSKPLTAEHWNKNQTTWYSTCRPCRNAARRKDQKLRGFLSTKCAPGTPKRLRRFGLTLAEHQDLLAGQNHMCGICRAPVDEKSPIDHCHETGAVRGVLCYSCNNGLGVFKEKAELLFRAASWLNVSQKQNTAGVSSGADAAAAP